MSMKESLFALWGKRNPQWEIQYEDTIIKQFTDYGKGTTQYSADRAKILGAGYEIYIMAFFIGLYSKHRLPLTEDASKRKGFGQPIMYWGNLETRKERQAYNDLTQYIFAALISRTDLDLLDVDKGIITPRVAVDKLITTMEEYANYGFVFMQDKLDENSNYFYNNEAFLNIFTSFISMPEENSGVWHSDDEPESLEDGSADNVADNQVSNSADDDMPEGL